MPGLGLLFLAIVFEVAATLSLKSGSGGSHPWTAHALALVGYAAAFACLARSLETIPVGLAYAVWAGVGTAGVALLAAWLFGESPPPAAWLGVALIVTGVGVLSATLPTH
ncbi:MAG TPA: multidrug efflux SMR transporter [Myxococcota bacterium]|nr:multidrug efflux SMR transporter [Myxococcota bacterium]